MNSEHVARDAMLRMHHRAVMVPQNYAAFVNDLMTMAKANPEEEQAALRVRQEELCRSYGMAPAQADKPFAFANGLAIIPVHGTLINRFGSSWGYVTGYNFIRAQVAAAGQDPDVKGIAYDINSYGGEVAGCFETAADLPRLANGKPTIAVVDSNAYSAAYATAVAANKIVVTPSGGAGSIGVVAMHVDMSGFLEKVGVKVTFIHSGDHKVDGNPYEPLDDETKAEIQADVDKTRAQFVTHVSTMRKLDAKKVHDTEARTYRAEDAMSLGLVDAVMTPQEAIAAFFGELSGSSQQVQTKEKPMSAEQEKGPEAKQADSAAAIAAAKKAERERVSAITNHAEAAGREKLANHLAMNTEMSVEEAAAVLAASPKAGATVAGANPFKAAMDADKHPGVGDDASVAAGGEGAEDMSAAKQVIANFKLATGAK